MVDIPQLDFVPAEGAYVKSFEGGLLILRHGSKSGIVSAYTREEKEADIASLQMLPGVIYQEDYYVLSSTLRFAIAALEAKIPEKFSDHTRFLDLRNGGVVRWNSNFVDDFGKTTFEMIDGVCHAVYELNPEAKHYNPLNHRRVTMRMDDDRMNVKIIRENTGILAIDDIDYLNFLLVMGMCVIWLGGKTFEFGSNLLGSILRNSGAEARLIECAKNWDSICTIGYGDCFPKKNAHRRFDSLRDFANYAGLSKLVFRNPRLVLPSRKIPSRKHWCASTIPTLDIFVDHKKVNRLPTKVSHHPLLPDMTNYQRQTTLLAAHGIVRPKEFQIEALKDFTRIKFL